MSLDPQTWHPHAEGLPLGRRRRVDHVCGPGRTLLLTHDGTGLHAWCFRCADSGFLPPPAPTLAELLARQKQREQANLELTVVQGIPDGVTNVADWPDKAKLWFYKAGLSNVDIKVLDARYVPASERVVLPFGKTYWLARGFNVAPKYLGPGNKPSNLFVSYGPKAESVVLTEDALSAYKIGKVTEAWPILGTAVSEKNLSTLLKRGVSVKLWLDPDPPGQRAAKRYMRQLTAYGVKVGNIISTRDPKLHFLSEIKEILR